VELVSVKTLRSEARTTAAIPPRSRVWVRRESSVKSRRSLSPISFTVRDAPTFDRLQTTLLAFGVVRISFVAFCATRGPLFHTRLSTREPQENLGLTTIGARGMRFVAFSTCPVSPALLLILQGVSIALVCRLAKSSHPRHDERFVEALFRIHWGSALTAAEHQPPCTSAV
jgi:hypothetical protein